MQHVRLNDSVAVLSLEFQTELSCRYHRDRKNKGRKFPNMHSIDQPSSTGSSRAPSNGASERKSAALWTAFILGLFGINLGIAGIALALAVGDPSFRPLPDYSNRAVDWQVHKDQLQESERLGWQARFDRSSEPAGIRVVVEDVEGKAVSGATGTLLAYHLTRVAENRRVALTESPREPGVYFAALEIDRDGKWQVALELSTPSGQRFIAERTIDWSLR